MTEKLGEKIYASKNGNLISGMVISVRKEIRLNTGSDLHGRTLPERIEYCVRSGRGNIKDVWVREKDSVFKKEEVYKLVLF